MSLSSASKSVVTRIGEPEFLSTPRTLGKYRVLFELGHGGMATVYLAVTQSAPGVNKLVALKTLLPEFAREAEACAMFLDEARLAVQLNHGNIVQTYEVGKEDGREIIVMEYLEGHSLASTLKRSRQRGQALPLGLHLRLLMQVLEGLHCTHELRGYDGTPLYPVHRDVSPQNVFITYDGRVKLLDFGIAKAASSTTHTKSGLIKGKIAYMSPEQMTGIGVDRRADVYAVGCMLWAAAAGRKLWHQAEDVKIMHDVVTDAIPPPSSHNPQCDPELERIVMKALARVESRYSSAQELHDDLERFCEANGIRDRFRELGRVMSELFAEDRAELRARVEKELSLVETGLAHVIPTSLGQSEIAPPITDGRQRTASSRTLSVSTVNSVAPKAVTRRRWPWLVAISPALALAVYLALPREHTPQVVARAQPIARVATDDKPASVKLELRSRPATARLFLDDKPIEGNPATQVLAKDSAVHRVRAELEGYRTASAAFTSAGDQVLDLQLDEVPHGLQLDEVPKEPKSAKRGSVLRPPQRPASAQGASPSAAKSTNCAQPFYVGADGIKKIKPACL